MGTEDCPKDENRRHFNIFCKIESVSFEGGGVFLLSEHCDAFLTARPLAKALQELQDFVKVGFIYPSQSYAEPHLSWKLRNRN